MYSPSRLLSLLLAFLAALLLAPSASASVRVVATVPDLAAIASEVVGEDGTVTAMALETQDPHFVDAKPNLALALSRADALLLVGLDLEIGWLPNLLVGSRNAKIQKGSAGYVDCSQFVRLLEVPTVAIDRSMGDIHPGGNPHYLLHPDAAIAVARGIAARLGAVDPEHASDFAARAESFASSVSAARAGWTSRLSWLADQPVIEYHRSWVYLADWVGFRLVADVEPKPGIPPNPAHVAKLVGLARDGGARLLVQEQYHPATTSQLIADKAGIRLLVLDGGAAFRNGESWLDRMNRLVDALASAGSAG